MILTCPQCGIRYRAEAAQFPAAGRKVRCAKCGHLWHQAVPEAESEPKVDRESPAAAASGSVGSFVAAQRRTLSSAPRGRSWSERLGLAAGWMGLAAMMLLIGWTGVKYRQEVAALWPQSTTFYTLLGMPVSATGLEIIDPDSRREVDGGQAVLAVTGRLVNISTRELAVPQIRVALIDGDERELCHWMFSPAQPTLRPGQSLKFQTRLSAPPAGARHLEMRIAASRE